MRWRKQKQVLRDDWRLIDLDHRHQRGCWGYDASETAPGRLYTFGPPYARTGDVVVWRGVRQIVVEGERTRDPDDMAFLTIEPIAKPDKLGEPPERVASWTDGLIL